MAAIRKVLTVIACISLALMGVGVLCIAISDLSNDNYSVGSKIGMLGLAGCLFVLFIALSFFIWKTEKEW